MTSIRVLDTNLTNVKQDMVESGGTIESCSVITNSDAQTLCNTLKTSVTDLDKVADFSGVSY